MSPRASAEIVCWTPLGCMSKSTCHHSSGSLLMPLVGKRVSPLARTPATSVSSRSLWSAQLTSLSMTSRAPVHGGDDLLREHLLVPHLRRALSGQGEVNDERDMVGEARADCRAIRADTPYLAAE